MTEQPAIPAATLILARDVPAGPPELLMVERAATMAFAAGAMVFPGGRIDPEDREFGEALGIALGAGIVAAVRETIEETAVPVALDPLPEPSLALELQRALLAGDSLASLLGRHHLSLDVSALVPWARWLPNFHTSRRFDTLFFLASAPPGEWVPNVGEAENRSAEWISAADVLARHGAGSANLIFPTRRNLERLSCHDRVAAMHDHACAHPVETITPWVEEQDGERWLTIPGHLGYPVTREKLDGLWRG
jgi:8-oxo-dGTP pyrophosphatase MutT (NUDIX family)